MQSLRSSMTAGNFISRNKLLRFLTISALAHALLLTWGAGGLHKGPASQHSLKTMVVQFQERRRETYEARNATEENSEDAAEEFPSRQSAQPSIRSPLASLKTFVRASTKNNRVNVGADPSSSASHEMQSNLDSKQVGVIGWDFSSPIKTPPPLAALRLGLSGQVQLRLTLNTDRSLKEVVVVGKSGSDLLDASAIEQVRAMWQETPSQQNEKSTELMVTITYAQ